MKASEIMNTSFLSRLFMYTETLRMLCAHIFTLKRMWSYNLHVPLRNIWYYFSKEEVSKIHSISNTFAVLWQILQLSEFGRERMTKQSRTGISKQCIKPVGRVVLDDHDLPLVHILLTPAPFQETAKLQLYRQKIFTSNHEKGVSWAYCGLF